MNRLKSQLEINNFKLKVKLGVGSEERSLAQDIEINMQIFFEQIPHGCISDKIEETVCYDTICKRIKNFCINNEFKLIENLTYQLHQLIKQEIKIPIKLSVKKCNPPIENLSGGAIFTISD